MDEEKKDFRLDVAKRFLERDAKNTSTLFAYYSINHERVDEFADHVESLKAKKGVTYPWSLYVFGLGEKGEFKITKTDCLMFQGAPEPGFLADRREIVFPKGSYMALSSPCKSYHGAEDAFVARRVIGMVMGQIIAVMGRGFVLDLMGEEILDPKTLKMSNMSRMVRIPLLLENFGFADPTVLGEVNAKLGEIESKEKELILYAWSMLGRGALEEDERLQFLSYWIALEVIASGNEKVVTDKLGNAYEADLKFVRDELELRPAIRMRAAIVHRGREPHMGSRMERLMTCYFVDLLRARLGLRCRRVAEGAIKAANEWARKRSNEGPPPGGEVTV